MDIDGLLEEWQVHPPGCWENSQGPKDWYAVSNNGEGIIAYFLHEKDALIYRMDMINRCLNS